MSKNNALTSIQTLLTRSGMSHTVLLTSFRRNGQGVGTPVGMMSADGQLYFMTPASTWKARRIANNPHVTLALCTFQGKVLSPVVDGMARRLAGSEARRARSLICAGFYGWLMNGVFKVRYPGDKTAVYEVVLQPSEQHTKNNAGVFRSGLRENQRGSE
jgi:PPOX class probable F420-dependent enzyme